jgi:phage terminase Nu1 subunit (DNA packaging protein)
VERQPGYSPFLMTATELISQLGKRGVEISRKTLFTYRAADPGEAPAGFNDVSAWESFIRERQVYEPGRTQSTEKRREAKERRPMSRNGRQQARRNLGNGDSDAEKYSLSAERKERILRLRLSNEMRRSKLEVLRQNTVAVSECVEALEGIKRRVSGELLRLPETLSHQLAHREPRHIQQLLDGALHSALERLSRPEDYFKSEPEHGAPCV